MFLWIIKRKMHKKEEIILLVVTQEAMMSPCKKDAKE